MADDAPASRGGVVNRGIAWVGIASSLVGLFDLAALTIMLWTGWISKAELGVAGMVVALFPVLDLATDLGISAALIQRDDHSREKIATVFWINVGISAVLWLLLFGAVGPAMAWIHGQPVLLWMLTAYGGKLMFQNLYVIPHALMRRELRFKELSVLRILANVGEFAGKVGFAWAGLGVWAFILGPLCRVLITGIGIQILHPWRPALVLRWGEAREWLAYGFRTSGSKILYYAYSVTDVQVVSYSFGKGAAGAYVIANNLILQPALVISEIITQVAFPMFARIKHDAGRLVDQLVAFSRMNLIVMISFLGVVFVATEPVIGLLDRASTEDWSAAVAIARVLCVVAMLRALSFLVPPLLDGIGKPHLTLRYSVVAAIAVPLGFVACAYLLGDRLGPLSVAVGWIVAYPIAFAFLFAMTFAAIGLRPMAFVRRIWRIPLWGGVALAAAELVHWLDAGLPPAGRLGLAIVTMVGGFALLLSRFEGIGPAAVARALREK